MKEPNTEKEFRALLGRILPKDLICYGWYPIIDESDRIIDFVDASDEKAFMFYKINPKNHTYHFDKKLEAYILEE